jgi:hypothetical protein
LPAPKLPPSTTVNLGTRALATAWIILAAMLDGAGALGLAADHVAGGVLQEDQRRAGSGRTAA